MNLEIIYQDEYIVGINKPNGILVHRTNLAYGDENGPYALQLLRNQLGRKVYPCHRIDRKTSGVLLFALDKETDSKMQQMIAAGKVQKEYLAIVRGYTDDQGIIDYPLAKENGTIQEAITRYKRLAITEIEVPFGQHKTSRYSLVQATPETGRMHQIRKHFAHIDHPIIGDRPHGCNKQNRLFKEKWSLSTMLLHSLKYSFRHPYSNIDVSISANILPEFKRVMDLLSIQYNLTTY